MRILEAQVLRVGGFDTFTVKTTAGDFDTISVILATGKQTKGSCNSGGLRELEGRGVSYCAVCAFFYRGKGCCSAWETATSLFMRGRRTGTYGWFCYHLHRWERTGVFQEIFFCGEYNENSVCRGRREGVGLRLISQSETDAKSDTDGEKNFQLLPEGKEAEMEASELHNPESPVRDSTETFVPADGVL